MDAIKVSKLSGFGRGKETSFAKEEVVLGTDAACDIRFDPTWDKTVSAEHAKINRRADGWWLTDSSRDGSLVEGRRIQQEKLTAGAVVELGKGGPRVRIDFSEASAPAAPRMIPQPAPAGGQRWGRNGDIVAPLVESYRPAGTESGRVRGGAHWRNPWVIAGAVALLAVICLVVWLLLRPTHSSDLQSDRVSDASIQKLAGADTSAGKINIIRAPQPGANADWQPVVDMGEEIFPAFILASATMKESPFDAINSASSRLGDRRGIIGVQLTSPAAHAKVRVEIRENEIMRASVFEVELASAGETYRIYPPPTYRFDQLAKVKQTAPLALAFGVSVDGVSLGEKSKTVRLASVNDCPFALTGGPDASATEAVAMHWMFSAYVNENHPISDELRREALKTGIVPAFVGYQGGAQAVYQQVFAIWYVLQKRGVRYSNVTTTPGSSKAVYSQYVRFIDQSINNSQANCVDGSVLFASVLRQIGIEPILVLVPGHMFVGFYVDEQGHQADFLETTMIGQTPSNSTAPAERSGFGAKSTAIRGMLEPAADTGAANKDSMEVFVAAIKTARQEAAEYFGEGGAVEKVSLYKTRTVRKEKANCQMLPVAKAREMGILPIGYQP